VFRLSLLLAAGSLCACAGPGGLFATGDTDDTDWTAYAADVYARPAAERQVLRTDAANAYVEQGGADAALRLAIVTATPDASEQDFGAALDLLDEAEAGLGDSDGKGDGDAASLAFIALLRPLLLTLQSQRSALAAESLTRQSLEEQLEELKALEETLNASAADR
jgi:hypothetical protein